MLFRSIVGLARWNRRKECAEIVIEFESVSKTYVDGFTAVNDFSLKIQPRSTTVLLGSSGCGKTTLLRMINRMVDPTGGRVLIDGNDVSGMNAVKLRRSIGYVLQEGGLMPHRSVADNVATNSSAHGSQTLSGSPGCVRDT